MTWLNLTGCAEPEQPLHECCFGPGSQKEATKYSKRAEKSLVTGKRHSQRVNQRTNRRTG